MWLRFTQSAIYPPMSPRSVTACIIISASARMASGMAALLIAACKGEANPPNDASSTSIHFQSTGTTSTGSTSIAPTLTTSEQPTAQISGTDGSDTNDPSCGLICSPDAADTQECSLSLQDCRQGFKCTMYAPQMAPPPDGTRCVPVASMPKKLNEGCFTKEYAYSGLDDCDAGLFCWGIDPQTLSGFCYPLCSQREPACKPPLTSCNSFSLCDLGCDPLVQGCGDLTLHCYPLGEIGGGFACAQIPGKPESGKTFEACIKHNDCSPSHACLPSSMADECISQGIEKCCVPFCDVTQDNSCPGTGQTCHSWFPEGVVPPNYLEIGICDKNG